MKITSKVLLGLVLFNFSFVLMQSCKKTDKIESTLSDAEAVKLIREKAGRESSSVTQILNINGRGHYEDLNGNSLRPSLTTGRSLSVCPDPTEDYPTVSFYSASTQLTCGTGYRIEVKYDLTLIYDPVYTNGSGLPSFGRLRLKNSSGTIIWPTTTPTPRYNVTNIENLGSAGTDPNGNPYTKWRITFITDYIPEATFDASASMEPYLYQYTNCPDVPTVVVAYSPQMSSSSTAHFGYPCMRTDKVYFNPRSGSMSASVAGTNASGSSCFPWGWVHTNKQHIQYKNTSGIWKDMHLSQTMSFSTVTTDGLIGIYDVRFIYMPADMATGNNQVRYRNDHTGGSSSSGGPCTGAYVYETWYIN